LMNRLGYYDVFRLLYNSSYDLWQQYATFQKISKTITVEKSL